MGLQRGVRGQARGAGVGGAGPLPVYLLVALSGWESPVGKKVQWPGVLVLEITIFRLCSDSNSGIASAREIVKSGANLVSDIKVNFLEIWNVPWRISMATIRRGAFIYIP